MYDWSILWSFYGSVFAASALFIVLVLYRRWSWIQLFLFGHSHRLLGFNPFWVAIVVTLMSSKIVGHSLSYIVPADGSAANPIALILPILRLGQVRSSVATTIRAAALTLMLITPIHLPARPSRIDIFLFRIGV